MPMLMLIIDPLEEIDIQQQAFMVKKLSDCQRTVGA
jgi:hypothetical protein